MNALASNDRRLLVGFCRSRANSLAGLIDLLLGRAIDEWEREELARIRQQLRDVQTFFRYLDVEVEQMDQMGMF